jgi:hypothetical protein
MIFVKLCQFAVSNLQPCDSPILPEANRGSAFQNGDQPSSKGRVNKVRCQKKFVRYYEIRIQ